MTSSTLPMLYKKSKTGSIEYWKVHTEKNTVIVEFGQLGTTNPQSTTDVITSGKNIGKANETTPIQQAQTEAQSKWTKQVKKGYVESIEAAKAGEINKNVITGGIDPMLAHKFNEQGHKIKYPCWIQKKYDGHRCIAMIENGKCTLWSRTRKPIIGVPHIIRALEKLFKTYTLILDGELYSHAYKSNFEEITRVVNQKTAPLPNHEIVEYHIYDFVHDELVYNDRLKYLQSVHWKLPLVCVQTELVKDEAEAMVWFDTFMKQGYEGAMIRNANGLYSHNRSYDLQKIKEFEDAEFPILGIEEGRGHLQGHVGSFICETVDGTRFNVKMTGETSKLKDYFENHSLWKGKKITVKYQGLTGKNNVPRFPTGVRIHEDV